MSIMSDFINGNLEAAREAIMTANNPAYEVLTLAKRVLRATEADPQRLLTSLRNLVDES